MNFKDIYSQIYSNVSQKVYLELSGILDELYNIEQNHTIVFMPFFGFIHIYGNELHPMLDFGTIMTLCAMKSRFKQLYVYRGETEATYGNDSSQFMEIFAQKQWILSNVLNKAISFSLFSQNYDDKLNLYENETQISTFRELGNKFSNLLEKYPLPYETAFDLENEDDLIFYIDKILKKSQYSDKLAKILLIYPTYLIDREHNSLKLKKVKDYIESINGTLYYATNYSGGFIRCDSTKRYDYKSVCTVNHFAKVYCEDIYEQMTDILSQSIVPEDITKGVFGTDENLILSNISGISREDLYNKKLIKDYK